MLNEILSFFQYMQLNVMNPIINTPAGRLFTYFFFFIILVALINILGKDK